ncbi:MAG: hypothetical protein L0Z70_09845 [Chloroflexi bacterium]|nr:hypothetical protein [Chloroflexota bacterium]
MERALKHTTYLMVTLGLLALPTAGLAATDAICTWTNDNGDNNWHVAANWACDGSPAVPTAADTVVIPTFDGFGDPSAPVIQVAVAEAGSVTIQAEASLTVRNQFTISGNLNTAADSTLDAGNGYLTMGAGSVVNNLGLIVISKEVLVSGGTTTFHLEAPGGAIRYYGAELTPNADLGFVDVYIYGNQFCGVAGNLDEGPVVRRCFWAVSENIAAATFRMYFDIGEANSVVDPLAHQWDTWTTGWLQAGATQTNEITTPQYFVQATDVNFSNLGVSKFTMMDSASPTAVLVEGFNARAITPISTGWVVAALAFLGVALFVAWFIQHPRRFSH